jgi:hypothetical protein
VAENPISRLQFAQIEIDNVFDSNYAREHPELLIAVMQPASSDHDHHRPRHRERCSRSGRR